MIGLGTAVREEDFDLDPTGNWTDYVQKRSGTTVLDQDRDHNHVNEIDTDEVHGDADNPITESTGTAWVDPVHDAAGNMTTVPKPSSLADGLTLKYDAWNRLVEVEDDEAEVTVAKYEYDGLNRRIKKHIDSQSPAEPDEIDKYEHFFYNASWQVLEMRDTTTENDGPESLQPDYQYVWSARYVDAPVLRDKNSDSDGLCDDLRLYYYTDANFNVTALGDTGGDAVERYLYDPYGKVTIYTGDWSSTRPSSLYSNPYLYTGRRLDLETGFYHYRNRHYHAELGRFISRDPIAYHAGDPNVYRYVGNKATTAVDPMGLWEKVLVDVYPVLKNGRCYLVFHYVRKPEWFDLWIPGKGWIDWTTDMEEDEEHVWKFLSTDTRYCTREGIACLLKTNDPDFGADRAAIEGLLDSAVYTELANEYKNFTLEGFLIELGSVAGGAAVGMARAGRVGPSGKPMIHVKRHSSLKRAKDAARVRAGKGGSVVKHPSPNVGKGHFHGVTRQGEKIRVHDEYPN